MRKLSLLVLLAVTAAMLVGCNDQIGSSDTGPAINPKAKAANEGTKAKGVVDFDEAK